MSKYKGCEELNNIQCNNLAVISHSYNNFQKDSIEAVASNVPHINVFVRTNSFSEIGNIIPIHNLERFSSNYKIEMTGTPPNIKIFPTSIKYIPTDRSYKKLGEKHFRIVQTRMAKIGVNPDIVHSHFTWSAGYVGARLKEEYDIPLVVTAHGYDIYHLPFKDEEWRRKIEYVLNTADHIITVSQSNLSCIKELDVSTQVTVIPNGFRGDLFYPRDYSECRRILNLPSDKKMILTVGNLEPVKGHEHLIAAFNELAKDRADLFCVIVGAGRLHSHLKRQIRDLGLEDRIMLVGGRPHEEIPIWMNACDLFVLPSLNEGNPTVMFECMACGKPFIGTTVGGIPEIITSSELGLLVEPGDSTDLANKLDTAIDMGWDNEKIIVHSEQYRWDRISEQIMNVYRRIMH